MPLFMCPACRNVENTALSNYWTRFIGTGAKAERGKLEVPPPLCSACDPEIGAWHGEFERRSAVGLVVGKDGFLYSQQQFDSGQVHHTTPDYVITLDHVITETK